MRTLVSGGVLYLSLDALEGGDPSSNPDLAGKKWLKLDPQAFGGGGEIGQSDPSGSLDALRGAKGDVKRVGTEKVRGTSTTRYRVSIDAEQAVSIGLATRVVAYAELSASTGDLANDLASGPALAYGATKVLIGRELDMDLGSAIELEAFTQALLMTTEDHA